MAYEFERAAYRVPYPPTARPTLLVGKEKFVVVDCSERGVRYECPAQAAPDRGARVEGSIRLVSGGPPHAIVGVVVRFHEGTVGLELERPGLPVGAVFAEQRWLARHYPARYGRK
jgi:hypothetical protein